MRIEVRVKIRSQKEAVEPTSETSYNVRVNASPVDGEANKRVIKLLAKYFKTAKSNIKLVSGAKSKTKVFEID